MIVYRQTTHKHIIQQSFASRFEDEAGFVNRVHPVEQFSMFGSAASAAPKIASQGATEVALPVIDESLQQ